MKFEYNRFFVEGSPEEVLKQLNMFGAEGWEVVHVTDMSRESPILSPVSAIWVKREVTRGKKHND